MEGNLRLKIDCVSLIVGSKCTVFALFYLVFEGNFPITSPGRAYFWRGDLTEIFYFTALGGLYLVGLIHGRAYFRNFTVCTSSHWTIFRELTRPKGSSLTPCCSSIAETNVGKKW